LACSVGWQPQSITLASTHHNAGFGNKFESLCYDLVYAEEQQVRVLSFTSLMEDREYHGILLLLAIPKTILFYGEREDPVSLVAALQAGSLNLKPLKRANSRRGTWKKKSLQVYRDALQRYLPLTPKLAKCVEDTPPDDKQLVVHARGDFPDKDDKPLSDGANKMSWLQPPCTLYEKIVLEHGFTKVRVAQGGETEHPCGFDSVAGKRIKPWFQSFAGRHPEVDVVVNQADTTHQSTSDAFQRDACLLLSATNLVYAFSTFSQGLLVLSKRVRNIYGTQPVGLFRTACEAGGALKGSRIHHYDVSRTSYNTTRAAVLDYFWNYPMNSITIQQEC